MASDYSFQLANVFVLCELGDFARATAELEDELDAFIASPAEENDADAVRTIASLCAKHNLSGQISPVSLFRKLRTVTSGLLGPEDPCSLFAELHLAAALLIHGQEDLAEEAAMALLDRCERRLGRDDPIALQSALLLVGVYAGRNDVASGQALVARFPALKEALLMGPRGKDSDAT